MLIDYANSRKVKTIIRGLRTIGDLEYESMLANTNKNLSNNNIETIFLLTDPQYAHISSGLVREILRLGGNVKTLIPEKVFNTISNNNHFVI